MKTSEKTQPRLPLINMVLLKGANCNFHEFKRGGTFQKYWGPHEGPQESNTIIFEMHVMLEKPKEEV